eukprot:228402-Karenia_brevis.AAC.1
MPRQLATMRRSRCPSPSCKFWCSSAAAAVSPTKRQKSSWKKESAVSSLARWRQCVQKSGGRGSF